MPIIIKGDSNIYEVKNNLCIGRPCLNLHQVSIRGATLAGSRFVGYRHCCARRDYYGCPNPIPDYDKTLAKATRAAGMKNT